MRAKFHKFEGKWISEGSFDTWEDLPKVKRNYEALYPNAAISSTHSYSDRMPGWPSVAYHKLIIEFTEASEEAEFLMREMVS